MALLPEMRPVGYVRLEIAASVSTMTSTQIRSTNHQQLYDIDFIQWLEQAAELLKQGRFDELDLENLVDEVEDLGRRERRSLESNLRVVLLHLLKWEYQPQQRSGSWKGSIREHRKRIQAALKDSPSFRNYYISIIEESHKTARQTAADETGLPLETFPKKCPYVAEQVLDDDFWPGVSN